MVRFIFDIAGFPDFNKVSMVGYKIFEGYAFALNNRNLVQVKGYFDEMADEGCD